MRIALLLMAWIGVALNAASALDYPASAPGPSHGSRSGSRLLLSNRSLEASWNIEPGRVTAVTVTNVSTGQALKLDSGHMPRIVLDDGQVMDLSKLKPTAPFAFRTIKADASGVPKEAADGGRCIMASFEDPASGVRADWSVQLRHESNYVIESLDLTSGKALRIRELVFADAAIDGARSVGEVAGSVVVAGDVFLAVEHPLARNTVSGSRKAPRVRCALPRGNTLQAGQTWRHTAVMGVVPPNQMRRAFLYYLERRRAHPYRPFLHYNSWYHLNIGRPNNHMTEAECLEAIGHLGRELIRARGVKLDAFVWDDGWDNFNSLWGFHKDFPDGFRKLKEAGAKYGAAQGVWMSPWGGYGGPKKKRIAYGTSRGYETNANGYSMAGAKYGKAFRDVCLRMMRGHGVVFFKFDGMGTGNRNTGAEGAMADDIDAVLALTRTLRRKDPDLFISATTGTWASPFWTLYADSVWRQGGDTGFHGAGNGRQRWITYRDKFCHECVVGLGPLYPLNALMLHGPCIGERGNPSRMTRDEKSVADEIWTFFGSGTNLQELYISPQLLTRKMWDELAAAAKWSRAHADVLVDTHWIGGDPGSGEVYGWASWQPRKGIVVLRNPSDRPQSYALELARDLELPDEHLTDYVLRTPRAKQRLGTLHAVSVEPLGMKLRPFEVLVFEATAAGSAGKYDAKAYRQRCAERKAARAKAARAAFAGAWEYVHGRGTYQRRFLPDGTAHLYLDGRRLDVWDGFTWRIEGGRLIVDKPDGGIEGHYLDDQGRLVLPAGLGTARRVEP